MSTMESARGKVFVAEETVGEENEADVTGIEETGIEENGAEGTGIEENGAKEDGAEENGEEENGGEENGAEENGGEGEWSGKANLTLIEHNIGKPYRCFSCDKQVRDNPKLRTHCCKHHADLKETWVRFAYSKAHRSYLGDYQRVKMFHMSFEELRRKYFLSPLHKPLRHQGEPQKWMMSRRSKSTGKIKCFVKTCKVEFQTELALKTHAVILHRDHRKTWELYGIPKAVNPTRRVDRISIVTQMSSLSLEDIQANFMLGNARFVCNQKNCTFVTNNIHQTGYHMIRHMCAKKMTSTVFSCFIGSCKHTYKRIASMIYHLLVDHPQFKLEVPLSNGCTTVPKSYICHKCKYVCFIPTNLNWHFKSLEHNQKVENQ